MENNNNINNMCLMKALEETNLDLAKQVIADEQLDKNELSNLLDSSIRGKFINNETGEKVELDNSVLVAGMLNLMNRL